MLPDVVGKIEKASTRPGGASAATLHPATPLARPSTTAAKWVDRYKINTQR